MNLQLIELGIQRGRLIERIAMQRDVLERRLRPVHRVLNVADRTLAVVRTGSAYVKRHPATIAAAVALLVALKPRRAWRWGKRGFVAWRAWRALRARFKTPELRH